MAIGRISGSVLKSNLTRNGTDLAFETNLLYLDVTNSRVGIGTSEPSTALQVNGTATTTGLNTTNLSIGGTAVTSTAVELNVLDGTTLTANEIAVADGTGSFITTSDLISIDTSNNRVGINTNSPRSLLDISSSTSGETRLFFTQSDNSTDAPNLRIEKSRGSTGSEAAVQNGDGLYRQNTFAHDGTSYLNVGQLEYEVNGSVSTGTVPTRFAISTRNNSTATMAQRLKVEGDAGVITFNDAYSFPTSDGSAGQFLTTDGSGALSFATVSTNSISQLNSNVTVTDSGTGAVTVAADGATIITMNASITLDASAATNSIRLPVGTTAQRPSGSTGEIRYNSSTDAIEGYTTAGGWAQLGATSSTSENTDDTLTGNSTAISTQGKIVNQFTTSSFDSAWYLTVTRDEINDQVSTAKHSLAHNNSDAVVSSSHITKSDATNSFVTIDADVTGGNARLKATGTSVVNSVSFYRIALGDNTTAGTTGSVTTVINTDVDSGSESIDSWAKASYRAAKYYISVNNASKTEVTNIEALVVHDGTTAFITAYGLTNTGSNDLINLTAAVDGSNVVVSATGNEPNLRVTAYRILLADDESGSTGDNVNVVAATTVSSTATTVDSFVNSAYTGAFYVFTGYNATEGAASAAEVMVVSNDEAYIAVGPAISTKGTDQLTFSATQSGSTVTVKAASTSGASTTVNGYRVHMLRGSAGASTADTVLVSTTQTITGAKTLSSPLALTVGSDPSTAANNAHIYAKDESSSAEVFVRDEAGNVTKISPHNEQGDWEYYSRNTKTGKTVRVNMEEMIRDIEKLTGKKYIKDF